MFRVQEYEDEGLHYFIEPADGRVPRVTCGIPEDRQIIAGWSYDSLEHEFNLRQAFLFSWPCGAPPSQAYRWIAEVQFGQVSSVFSTRLSPYGTAAATRK